MLPTVVIINIFLFFAILIIDRFFFNFKFKSMINKSGFKSFKPSILQFSKALSLLIVVEVENIQSFLDLNKCVIF